MSNTIKTVVKNILSTLIEWGNFIQIHTMDIAKTQWQISFHKATSKHFKNLTKKAEKGAKIKISKNIKKINTITKSITKHKKMQKTKHFKTSTIQKKT